MALDRVGITTMLESLFEADTGILYGSTKLVQTITGDLEKFENAKVDVKKPYKMYLRCQPKTPTEVRAQNTDNEFLVDMRIEGYKINPNTTAAAIDDIDARVEYLINNQMWSGQMFTSYYTDSNAQVIDAEYQTGELVVETRNDKIVAEGEGSIIIRINRWA